MKSHHIVAALVSLAGLATAFEETIQGYKFIHTGPKTDAAKSVYENAAKDTALKLLTTRLGAEGLKKVLDPESDTDNARCVYLKDGSVPRGDDADATDRFCLSLIKRKLGADGLKDTLRPDIDEANAFWTDIVGRSTPNSHISADASTIAFLPGLNAVTFAKWTQSPLADQANNDANPEHYFKITIPVNPTTLASQILEGWGGVTTRFNVLDYTLIKPGQSDKYPFIRPMQDFPIQAVGGKNLTTGLVFGALHICVRDVKGSDYGSDIDGIEIAAAVWYGDALTDEHLEFEAQHMIIEMVNLSLVARSDVANGKLPPS